MPATRSSGLSQLGEIWSHLSWAQRLWIGASALAGLAAIGAIVFFMNRVEYEVLYRDLNAEDAQAIAAKLKEDKKDYLVQGTSILVAGPQTDVDKLRLEIAGSGLARSGKVGYEIFDKSQFGMTDFTEQVNLQRALEGELSRTISSLSEIAQARVHLVLPKDSIFDDRKEDAKASVAVVLKHGEDLSESSIAGIRGLVAGAVPGLHTYNVSIVDEQGHLLSRSAEGGEGARAEFESGIREQLEKEMVQKVFSILEPIVGKGKVHANASLELDFNSSEETEETFNPNPAAVLSQQRSEERVGGGSAPSGVPGTQSNVAPVPGLSIGASADRLRQSEMTNYEMNKLVRHTIQPKGTVKRFSVAVILDHKTAYAKDAGGKITSRSEPRTEQDLGAIRELVLATLGYNEERGDVVTIENVPFFADNKPEEERPPLSWYAQRQVYLLPAMKYVSFILLFFMVYLVLFRPIRKRIFQSLPVALPAAASENTAGLPEAAARALGPAHTGQLPASSAPQIAGELPAEGLRTEDLSEMTDEQIERELMREASMLDIGGRKYAIIKKKLTEKARRDPELVSQLLRSWMREKG